MNSMVITWKSNKLQLQKKPLLLGHNTDASQMYYWK